MTKTTFVAIDPQGKAHTRKTERVYTHCVVQHFGGQAQFQKDIANAQTDSGRDYYEKLNAKGVYETFGVIGWCGRHDLAIKLQAKWPGSIIVEAAAK